MPPAGASPATTSWMIPRAGRRPDDEFAAFAAAESRRIPLGRLGRPDDVAGAVPFLASDHARYITGTVILVTGGLEMISSPAYQD